MVWLFADAQDVSRSTSKFLLWKEIFVFMHVVNLIKTMELNNLTQKSVLNLFIIYLLST